MTDHELLVEVVDTFEVKLFAPARDTVRKDKDRHLGLGQICFKKLKKDG